MPNNFFKFKKFTVYQADCAMKVCTDACLFGAWAATLLPLKNAKTILDAGSGSGLLSLMLAQKTTAEITAVEIDEAAAKQCRKNFKISLWKTRLSVFYISFQQFSTTKKFDFIICNPPFFENDLKSSAVKRNAALHSTHLTFVDLVEGIKKHLDINGSFAILLPFYRSDDFEKLAQANNFFLNEKINISQTEHHSFFRSMLLFGKKEIAVKFSSLSIKDFQNGYTADFINLLKDYYLYL